MPPSASSKRPLRSCARVGEGAAHVAEHLALEQRRRDAAEVHLDERPARAPAVAVDGFGDQLLARAALAGDRAPRRRSARPGRSARRMRTQPRVLADEVAEVVARVELLARGTRASAARGACRRGQRRLARSAGSAALVHGLVMKSDAPAFIPSTASSIEPHAVISITGSAGCAARICASSASPSSPLVCREKFMSCSTSSQALAAQPRQRLVGALPRHATRSRPA